MDRTRLEREVVVAMNAASDELRTRIIELWDVTVDTVLVLSVLTDEQLLEARAILQQHGLLTRDP